MSFNYSSITGIMKNACVSSVKFIATIVRNFWPLVAMIGSFGIIFFGSTFGIGFNIIWIWLAAMLLILVAVAIFYDGPKTKAPNHSSEIV